MNYSNTSELVVKLVDKDNIDGFVTNSPIHCKENILNISSLELIVLVELC
jgi:hypothetical protein